MIDPQDISLKELEQFSIQDMYTHDEKEHSKYKWNFGTTWDTKVSKVDNFKQFLADKLNEFDKKLESMRIDGSISIAKTDMLKAQKKGELMMIEKVKHLIKQIFMEKKQ